MIISINSRVRRSRKFRRKVKIEILIERSKENNGKREVERKQKEGIHTYTKRKR